MRHRPSCGAWIGVAVALVAASGIAGAAVAATSDAAFGADRFMAGDDVTVQQAVAGDVFVAGGRAKIAAPVAGDALVASGNVEVRADIGDDLYIAGGSARVAGGVAGNARIAGGSVDLQPHSHIEGSATLAGGRIRVEGTVGRGLQAFAQRVVIEGVIGGDVVVAARELVVGPDAHIDGELRYRGPGEPVIAPGAEILGGVVRHGVPDSSADADWQWNGRPAQFMVTLGRFFWGLGIFVLGAVMLLLMPAFTRTSTAAVGREPMPCIGIGALVLFAIPLAILLLFLTLVGIPLGLAAMFGYGLLLMLGYMTGALFVGDWMLDRFAPRKPQSSGARILALLGALLLIAIARHVPVAGPLAILLLFLAGLGAWTRSAWRVLRPPRATTTA